MFACRAKGSLIDEATVKEYCLVHAHPNNPDYFFPEPDRELHGVVARLGERGIGLVG